MAESGNARAAASGRRVIVVAACAQTKRYRPESVLCARTLSDAPLAERVKAWTERLATSKAERIDALEMYRGQHWSVIRRLPEAARSSGLSADLWVASAGYGLIPASASIVAYSATFAAKDVDAVTRRGDGEPGAAGASWWERLADWEGPVPGAMRSLSELARQEPEASLLLVAGPAYVRALEADLRESRRCLKDPSQLIIVTSRDSRLPKTLLQNVVPSESSLKHALGGSMTSLHARTAERILTEASVEGLGVRHLSQLWAHRIETDRSLQVSRRQPMTRDDVIAFIRKTLSEDARATRTRALRALRESGMACEQSRFAALFDEVKRNRNVR